MRHLGLWCRTEQRAEIQRKMYNTARILNEVIDALTKEGQTDEFNEEVSGFEEPCSISHLYFSSSFSLHFEDIIISAIKNRQFGMMVSWNFIVTRSLEFATM